VGCPEKPCIKLYNIELKEPADYVSSVLGKNGHLYQQYLSMAEAGAPCMILVLGSDDDVHAAIFESLMTRYHGQERMYQIASYEKRLIDFEANAEALGCPVERWDSMPYSRLLSRVAKRLEGKASLMDYRPRPAEEEREVASLAMLLGNGIGESKAKAILEKFSLKLDAGGAVMPSGKNGVRPVALTDCPGIGPKLAERIRERVKVVE
jgi:ERCC4-type nuclease